MKPDFLYRFILLAAIVMVAGSGAAPEKVVVDMNKMRCELMYHPQNIDVAQPRLSWVVESSERNVMQTAYQVLVATSKEKLEEGKADLWNSGKVNSDQSVNIVYAGKPLTSRLTCYWKAKVWTNKGESAWSNYAQWGMGLLNATDWKGKWIGLDRAFPWDSVSQWSRLSARYFRKEVILKPRAVKRAVVYVAGLGLHELHLNGQLMSEDVLYPAPTDYDKTVFYTKYDVTAALERKNCIGVVLGNGRYFTMRQNYKPKKIRNFGYPKMLLQFEIEYEDGTRETIVSDESWRVTADGPIRTNNEYDGEEYDATKEMEGWSQAGFKDDKWLRPQMVKAPGGVLRSQMHANMAVKKTVKPVSIKKLDRGVYIIDMGQNMVGWIRLRVKGERGDTVTMRFAESLQSNGELFTANLRDARVTDKYILKGGDWEEWRPSFVYHGFRYVEVSNYPGKPVPENFVGEVVYDDIRTIGEFESSNTVLNTIYKNAWWGIAGNYKGMPIDCPQRNERQPWLGDRTQGSLGESFLFDNATLYAKWMNDIQESQTAAGGIPDVAPAFWNYYSDNITWPAAYVTAADMLYTQFADQRSLRKHYPYIKKWLAYTRGKYMKDYIVTRDKYGDWCVPPESPGLIHSQDSTRKTDGTLLATAYYYRMLHYMQKFARLQGKASDEQEFAALAAKIKDAFNKKFFDKQRNYYSNNTVTANLLPLYFGITPDSVAEPVFNNIVQKIHRENHDHISTGVIGTQWLMRTLSKFERPDLAYAIATNTTYPSWGYMAENGATTIWELWNGNTANPGMNSQNHVMLLGDLLTWYYENLAGIKSDSVQTGFKKIIMKPTAVDGLDFVKASYTSIHGLIKSEWKNSIDNFTWHVTIPANTKAELHMPASAANMILENGKPIAETEGVKLLRMEPRTAVLEIGSGTYSFVSNYAWKKGIVRDEFIYERAPFPSAHAATIAETPAGLVAAWFGGLREGAPDVGIWMSRLENEKWTKPVEVTNGVLNDTLRYACYNPVLYQVPGGELLLFYKVGPRVVAWTGWMMSSKDNGLTWSKPRPLPEGFLGPVKNKPVLLSTGELLCASSTEGNGWKVHFEITPDFGKTWRKIGPIHDGKKINAIQPSVLFHKDGRLQILCRTRNRAIMESWSSDNGKTWTEPALSSLPNNNSGTDAVTLKNGSQLLVYNHVLPPGNLAKGPRTPLNVSLSDDGKNWDASLVLEDSPISQYSYPSVIQGSDGMIHIVYTWRRERIKYVRIDPSQLERVKITDGKWPGDNHFRTVLMASDD